MVAWHEVPGHVTNQDPSVGNGMIGVPCSEALILAKGGLGFSFIGGP
jgi:hypothetical protein